jgi:putative flippase GtrA
MRLLLPLRLARFFLGDFPLFLRYISIGALSAMIELALFSLAYQYLGWPLLVANSSALAFAVVVNFAAQKKWTFRAKGEANRQFRLYVLMQAISAVLNNLLIYLMIARWDWSPPLAKVTQIGLVFAWNFSFCKLVVFARRTSPSDRQA